MNNTAGDALMRVVVVNHVHPSVPHVSGMRAWHFAQELAVRGHQVILVCEQDDRGPGSPDPSQLQDHINAHDWRTPLVIAVTPTPFAALNRVRSPRTGSLHRKSLVVWSYVRHSGMFTDFSAGAAPFLPTIASVFQPQIVWGMFGNTDCWLIAQRLARLARCKWVADMKDSWDEWIPRGLKTLVARRFRDMSAGTSNAEFHAGAMARWFPARPSVVYSGVAPEFMRPRPQHSGRFRVTLVGATYAAENLSRFVRAFSDWVQSLPSSERQRITLGYAGSDAALVEAAVTGLESVVHLDIRNQLPLPEFAALCGESALNAYLWSPATFHHKVVELLACQRPILSFPGERAESLKLAELAGGTLLVCADESQVRAALARVWNGGAVPVADPERLQQLTWTAQAGTLERVLRRAAGMEATCAR
ncbi:MAG: hypothetical protein IPL75_17255 [Acidobacteria bacterium]|nr:hypothetical protein [Acidobacteriota bacterium]